MAQINTDITFSDLYVTPPIYSVDFLDVEKRRLYFFDGFNPDSNEFTMPKISFTLGSGQQGQFSIDIDDSLHRVIDREIFDVGGYCIIYGGRKASEQTRMLYGNYPTIATERRGATGFKYSFKGVGYESLLSSILMNVKIKAPVDPTTNQFVPSVGFQAKNIIKDICHSPQYMIPANTMGNFDGDTLAEATDITTNGISEDLKDHIFELDFHQTPASQIFSSIEDQLNVDIFVDAFGDLNAKYETDLHSGMTIKTQEELNDAAATTGYVQHSHDFEDSISPSDYNSRLLSVGRLTSSNEGSTSMSGFLSLYNKDIAQQIPVSALRLDNLAIIIERIGTGTNTNNPKTYQYQGAILEDNADRPSNRVIAKFFIPITKIPQNPTQYHIAEIVKTEIRVDPTKKYWLALFEVGDSEDNTIRWYHDGDAGREIKTLPNAIKPLPTGRTTKIEADKYDDTNWRVGWTGPTFSYIFQSKDSHDLAMRAPAASKRWGRRDARVSSLQQGVSDSGSMISAMARILENSARKIRTYDFPEVSIPYKFFQPGTLANFIDPAIGITRQTNYSIMIDEVGYEQDAKAHAKGNPFCKITAHKKIRPNQKYLKTKLGMV
jgi:hypothetical protein